jgi:probable HAF family extracellular repeat protein
MTRRFAGAIAIGALVVACQSEKSVPGPEPVQNQAPIAKLVAPGPTLEGTQITFSTAGTADPDGDELRFAWDFGDRVTLMTRDRNVGHSYRDNGSYTVTLIVSDPDGAADTASATIAVANVAPQITLLTIPDHAVAGGIPVRVQVAYSDPGLDDSLQAMIWWIRPNGTAEGDGMLGPGTVEHTFSSLGEYRVTLTIMDKEGAITESSAEPLVIGGGYYAVIDLGTLGGNSSTPVALNDVGQVVGCSTTAAGKTHAFVWSRGAITDLSPDLDDSCAQVITNSGVIGGVATTGGVEHVAQWSGSAFTDLGPCCQDRLHGVIALTGSELVARGFDVEYGYSSSFWQNGVQRDLVGFAANRMNNKRQIAGSSTVRSYRGGHVDHAFLWENGVMRDLGLLGDFPCTESPTVMCGTADAVDINNDGIAVGTSSNATGAFRGVRWINGTVEDLGFPYPVAINSVGEIVGNGQYGTTGGQGYFWRGGVLHTLGSFGGGGTSVADMNDQSTVVGTSLTADHVRHAFVWTPDDGRLIDLGAGPRGAETGVLVIAVNARGDIIGRTVGPGASRAVLWKVIP